MKAFANLSIRNKLVGIILVSTILSLATGFLVVIWKSVTVFHEEMKNSTGMIAEVVAKYVAINLYFWDVDEQRQRDLAEKALGDLSVHPWISDAYLFDGEKEIFADYVRRGTPSPPSKENIPDTASLDIRSGQVHAFTPVIYDEEDEEPRTLGTLYLRGTTERMRQQVSDFFVYMLFLLAGVVILATALAYLLQGVISKPILHLAEMAQRISNEADYSVRVKKPGSDEIGILYDGFNNMLEQIQQRQEDLERSNRDLDQFAYVASHDLKAPLRAIATLSGWIEEDLRGDLSQEAHEQMTLLRSRVQRMDQLIDGILQYSRAGRLDTHGERVAVGVLVGELVEILDPPEGVQIIVGPGMPTLETRRLRLEQVFSNLINNAIKYHDRPDGRIQITARRRGRFYEFAVSDDGPGIAVEHHEKVFMMFQTLQPRDQVESTGLGLSLVKRLVEEEGGTIELESSVGQGATFRFTWPAGESGESLEDVQS